MHRVSWIALNRRINMLAQVSLIPAESKKLIAKAVARMEVVQRALEEGMIVLHPSSSTYFIVEEITGRKPPTNVWVSGAIVPKGACGEVGMLIGQVVFDPGHRDPRTGKPIPGNYPHSWVLRKGEWSPKEPIGSLLEEMGPKDIYVKGVNALDIEGNVGVLWGNEVKGGTAALAMAARRRRGFQVILPVGLEKLIPLSIRDASKEAKKFKYDYSMGVSCGLLPCTGIVVTELKAIEILSGATAVPIAAGGLGGAEGAVTLVIKGNKQQVFKAVEYVESAKGAQLPPVRVPNCYDCPVHSGVCTGRLGGKPWVNW
jgi:hypothetical protein